MPKPRTVYRGKRKYSWIITLALSVLVVLIVLAVWLFYYLQKFIVYDKDGLRLVLPSAQTEQLDSSAEQSPGSTSSAERIDVEIVVDRTDYSGVVTAAGEDLLPLRAVYVPAEDVTEQNLSYYASGMGEFNALVLELKPADGCLVYHSGVALADSYDVNGTLELGSMAAKLKNRDVYLTAQLSCLIDSTMAVRNAPIALQNAATGGLFTDAEGAWLDPYSDVTRSYLTALMTELADMGFDEILLSGVRCPDSDALQFSRSMTLSPDAASAVSSLALYLREQADALGIRLSAVAESPAIAAGTGEDIGQDLSVFFKAFDRVVYLSDPAARSALETALGGGDENRIVPLTVDYVPENESFIVK